MAVNLRLYTRSSHAGAKPLCMAGHPQALPLLSLRGAERRSNLGAVWRDVGRMQGLPRLLLARLGEWLAMTDWIPAFAGMTGWMRECQVSRPDLAVDRRITMRRVGDPTATKNVHGFPPLRMRPWGVQRSAAPLRLFSSPKPSAVVIARKRSDEAISGWGGFI